MRGIDKRIEVLWQEILRLKRSIGIGGGVSSGSSGITALTGDVTASGTGSVAATITNNAVTNAKLADMVEARIKGRAVGAGTGDPQDLTGTQATAILDPFVGDTGTGGTKGLVPAPAAGDAAAGKFLKADGTWAVGSSYTDEQAQDAVGTILVDSATIDFTYADGTPSITAIVIDDSISDSKLRNSAALSVIGRSANSTGDPADIAAASDHQVFRRSGTAIGFGAVNLASSNAVTGLLPLANIATRTGTLGITIDGGGATITVGIKGDLEVPVGCTITQVTMLADQSGSIVIDIWKDAYSAYPPVVGDSITASAKPTITTATKSKDSTLTGWSTSLTTGDTLRFNVDSVTTIQRVTLQLTVTF